MGRAQDARAKAKQQKKNQPKIGKKATLNGKPVIYAGGDYGYQSPASFKKLKEEGQLALGAAIFRPRNEDLKTSNSNKKP